MHMSAHRRRPEGWTVNPFSVLSSGESLPMLQANGERGRKNRRDSCEGWERRGILVPVRGCGPVGSEGHNPFRVGLFG